MEKQKIENGKYSPEESLSRTDRELISRAYKISYKYGDLYITTKQKWQNITGEVFTILEENFILIGVGIKDGHVEAQFIPRTVKRECE